MHFSRDRGVAAVLESSCIPYTLRFCVRRRLALTKKSLFLEMPRKKTLADFVNHSPP